MKSITTAVGLALSLGVVSTTFSQQASTSQDQTAAPAQPTQGVMPAPGPAMSVAGCLYREWDLPALIPSTPDTAQKPVVLEGYIVADARIVGRGSSAPGHVGGTGGRSYRVEGIPVAQLRALVGKRVEIAGRIETDDEDGSRPDRNPVSRDLIDFSDFVASSIREVAGGTACSPKPAVVPIPPR
jgi:hypothetical protein